MIGAVFASIRAANNLGNKGADVGAGEAKVSPVLSQNIQNVLNNPAMLGNPIPERQSPPPAVSANTAGAETDYGNMPILARLPADIAQPESHEFHEQQIYNLFQMAFHSSIMGRSKMIVVTSTRSGEGEAKTAFDIARMMSSNRLKAVLVEADIRNPEYQEHLGLGYHPGLAELLSGRSTIAQSIIKNSGKGIDVIPSGQYQIDPQQLLTPERLGSVLTALERIYDAVIVKTPPIGKFPETAWLAGKSCMTMICMKSGTSGNVAVQSLAHLTSQGAGPSRSGFVLTGLAPHHYNPQFNPAEQALVNPQARPYPTRGGTPPPSTIPDRFTRAA